MTWPSRSSRHVLATILVVLCTTLCNTRRVCADASSQPRNSIPRSTHNGHYQRLRAAATADEEEEQRHSNKRSKNSNSALTEAAPQSSQHSATLSLLQERPPWNPSPQIDETGFVKEVYTRIPGEWENDLQLGGKHQNPLHLEMVQAHIRQVPGDGNCLFHSISTCMAHVVNRTQLAYPQHLGWLYRHSAQLRQQAVDCLRHNRKILFLQGNEYLRAHDLVEAAAAQYGISSHEYCDSMQQDSYWGGGPEIVALCNVLKRPIHVYELASGDGSYSSSSRSGGNNGNGKPNHHPGKGKHIFVLRRMACFGSPKFDKKEPFHILSADSRFPDISPGRQLSSGNHFLAVFPLKRQEASLGEWITQERRRKRKQQRMFKKKRRNNVRGGGGGGGGIFGRGSDNNGNDFHRTAEEAQYHLDEHELLDTQQRMVLDREHRRRQQQHKDEAAATVSSIVKSHLGGLWNRIFLWALNNNDEEDGSGDS